MPSNDVTIPTASAPASGTAPAVIPRESLRIRDPFVLPREEGFVLYGSTDPNTWDGPGTGLDCYRSDDLENWEGPFPAFRPAAGFWGTTQFWAPEVHAVGDRFLMFATFSDGERRGTQVLTASDPLGPFVPVGDGPITPAGWSCLDGTLHLEGEQGWIVYCHEWTQARDGRILAQRLDDDLTATVGEPVPLFSATDAPWVRGFPGEAGGEPDCFVTDGPFLHRTAEGALLMLWSSIGERGYACGIARSASGGVLGPWVQEEQPIWPEDGGHGMLFAGPGGALRLALHRPNNSPEERPVFLDVREDGDTLRVLPR